MKDLGITPGKWYASNEYDVYSHAHISGNIICEAPINWEDSCKFWYSNANLIADAGTTANKCGLLPSELLAQRYELMDALKRIESAYDWRDDLAGKIAHETLKSISK